MYIRSENGETDRRVTVYESVWVIAVYSYSIGCVNAKSKDRRLLRHAVLAEINLPLISTYFTSVSLKSAIGLSCLSVICPASHEEQAITRVGCRRCRTN